VASAAGNKANCHAGVTIQTLPIKMVIGTGEGGVDRESDDQRKTPRNLCAHFSRFWVATFADA
jgi:hypothetical protein